MGETPAIAVTGATGGLGGRVARRLAERGVPQRLVVRDEARAPRLAGATVATAAYADGEALRRAFDGVRTVFLVSAAEDPDRVRLHTTAVDAAVAAGVERVVYTSFVAASAEATFTFARDHWHTEQHVRGTGLRFTFLRDGLYADFLPGMASADGVIRGPAGDGRFAPVVRDDVADAALAVLTGDGHDGRSYDLTGPERLSMADVAAFLTEASGRPVRYVPETIEEAYASRASYGAPAFEVTGWVTTYAAIATGELDVVSDAVERLAGHPPARFADHLAADPASWAHLRD